MIEVRDLTKKYGAHLAVEGLSFTVQKGRIYGLLGPNGAGKSTTMNILTGYLAPTAGTVTVNGYDIVEKPQAAKACIGYLPEQPPLYRDMTVGEYLDFAARLKQVKKAERAAQVEKALRRTGLTEVKHRLIRQLSKGYCQRVGVAQTLLGDPQVIILDEPMVGLDPAQVIEIRRLIRELGKNHTVILSSHILSEVQAICDEVLIIAGGHLVAEGTPETLSSALGAKAELEIAALGSWDAAYRAVSGIKGVKAVTKTDEENGEVYFTVETEANVDPRADISRALAGAGCAMLSLQVNTLGLEEIFLQLTENAADAAGEV